MMQKTQFKNPMVRPKVLSSAGVGMTKSEGRMVEPSKRGNHDRALMALSTPAPRKVQDLSRSWPKGVASRGSTGGNFSGRW